jgi:hypothetical protein
LRTSGEFSIDWHPMRSEDSIVGDGCRPSRDCRGIPNVRFTCRRDSDRSGGSRLTDRQVAAYPPTFPVRVAKRG